MYEVLTARAVHVDSEFIQCYVVKVKGASVVNECTFNCQNQYLVNFHPLFWEFNFLSSWL